MSGVMCVGKTCECDTWSKDSSKHKWQVRESPRARNTPRHGALRGVARSRPARGGVAGWRCGAIREWPSRARRGLRPRARRRGGGAPALKRDGAMYLHYSFGRAAPEGATRGPPRHVWTRRLLIHPHSAHPPSRASATIRRQLRRQWQRRVWRRVWRRVRRLLHRRHGTCGGALDRAWAVVWAHESEVASCSPSGAPFAHVFGALAAATPLALTTP